MKIGKFADRFGAGPSSSDGGSAPLSLGDLSQLVYVACPACKSRIHQPFSRRSGPVAFVHSHRGRADARLIVIPDRYGEDHRVCAVARHESLESALSRAMLEESRS